MTIEAIDIMERAVQEQRCMEAWYMGMTGTKVAVNYCGAVYNMMAAGKSLEGIWLQMNEHPWQFQEIRKP